MNTSLVLDTSAYFELQRGSQKIKSVIELANLVVLPVVVLGELRAGFLHGSKQAENEKILQQFLKQDYVETADMNQELSIEYSVIYQDLKLKGRPMGANDIWIAAIAKNLDLPLLTLDKGFLNIELIKLMKA